MTLESVRAWLAGAAPDLVVTIARSSTATVAEAAATIGVEPARIAKTLAIRSGDRTQLLVTSGDARLDNARAKAALGTRPRMLDAEATRAATGHPIGGVSPFGVARDLPVICDPLLLRFSTVFPAAGSPDSYVEVEPRRLAALVGASWISLCRLP